MKDTRNLIDSLKGKTINQIIDELDANNHGLEIAVENLERDFNMGTIVRNANAFGVRTVHIIGRRQWNKRGAMMTDKYLHVVYYEGVGEFINAMQARNKTVIAIDNVDGSSNLSSAPLPKNAVLVFGAEGPGVSNELLKMSSAVVAIEQFGSTRSVNVGVAAGIAMYEWLKQHRLT